MSDGWRVAQERLRRRIWAARAADGGQEPEPPSSALLQAPELIAPAIASHRRFVGPPIRVLKRILHRLLAPLVFTPQDEFNRRVAARLNASGVGNVHEIERRIQEMTEMLGESESAVLALRAELQAQQLILERISQPPAASRAEDAGTGAA